MFDKTDVPPFRVIPPMTTSVMSTLRALPGRVAVVALSAVAVLTGTTVLTAADDPAKFASVGVYPADVHLTSAVDRQRVIVQGVRPDGVTVDLTDQATWDLADASLVTREGNTFAPAKDGKTTLTVKFGSFATEVPVEVSGAATTPPTSFHLDVMPVFMRAGCNTGSCHGAARGKDGFRISLFGFDPNGDYFRLTREIGTRRINVAMPEDSLLLTKSTGAVPHTGGKRFEKDSGLYDTVKQWLVEGAKNDEGEPPHVTKLEVYPPKAVLEGTDTTQRFVARAVYSDGTDRDVTDLAVWLTNNDNSAPVSEAGLVSSASRGEAFVMARYETHTVGSQVLVLPANLDYKAPEVTGNYIDELIAAKLKRIRVLPSGPCTDEEFLRRVTIDITGQLPTEEEYRAFMVDKSGDKRAKVVADLLTRKDFSEIWAMKWSELLMIKTTNQVSNKSVFLYQSWLSEQIANNVPLDEMVRDLLGSTGGTFTNAPTNYYQIETDTLKTAENVAQVFMGIRTQCAQCHNHPFDRWTMDDYYGFAAFFTQIGRKNAEDYRERIIYNRGGGEMKHPVTGKNMDPTFLGGEKPDTKGQDRRVLLADWLTDPENPYFSTSVANRVWAHFFGRGIVEPVDDIRVSNPATNPELFEELGKKLVEYKYDFRRLVTDICLSDAYQRSHRTNESNAFDEQNFSHALVRRMPAEMMLDCISQVTNTKNKFNGLPLGARAIQIADGNTSTYFLTTFGRAKRETVCACEATTDPTLSQALHMLNGDTVHGKIAQGGVVRDLLKEGKTPEQVIETLFIRTLTRKPTDAEMKSLMAVVEKESNKQLALDDVFWGLLNSREFMFNH